MLFLGLGVPEVQILAARVGAGQVVDGCSAFNLICDFGHGFEVIFVAVVEGVGEEAVEAMLVVLFDVEISLVVLLELGNIEYALFDLFLDLVAVKLDYGFGRTQEGLVVVDLVQQQLQLGDDIVHSVHFTQQV